MVGLSLKFFDIESERKALFAELLPICSDLLFSLVLLRIVYYCLGGGSTNTG